MLRSNRKAAKKNLYRLNDELYYLLSDLLVYVSTTRGLSDAAIQAIKNIFHACNFDYNDLIIHPDKLDYFFFNMEKLRSIATVCEKAKEAIKKDKAIHTDYICKKIDDYSYGCLGEKRNNAIKSANNGTLAKRYLTANIVQSIGQYLTFSDLLSLQVSARFFFKPVKKLLTIEKLFDEIISENDSSTYIDYKKIERAKKVQAIGYVGSEELMNDVTTSPILALKCSNQMTKSSGLGAEAIVRIFQNQYHFFNREKYFYNNNTESVDNFRLQKIVYLNESLSNLVTEAILNHRLIRHYLAKDRVITNRLAEFISKKDMSKILDKHPELLDILGQQRNIKHP